ncbi:MAG: hypothetical protein VX777_07360 [Chlamydiota bacterium]|nr:hypothetical protein [Chlamydiota bacterium]
MTKYLKFIVTVAVFLPFWIVADNPDSQNNQSDRFDTIHVNKFFPEGWAVLPAINPALPDTYECLELTNNELLWGTREDLISIKTNQSARIYNPLFLISYFSELCEENSTTIKNDNIIAQLIKQHNISSMNIKRKPLGKYSLHHLNLKRVNEATIYFAWLGSTQEQSGLTVVMMPCNQFQKNQKTWNNFITQTKWLDEEHFYIAKGLDMHEGYSFYKKNNAKVKVNAERRMSDGEVIYKIEPITDKTSFVVAKSEVTKMKSAWKNNEPCLKIMGVIVNKQNKKKEVSKAVITILPTDVEEFSIANDKSSLEQKSRNFEDIVFLECKK